MKPYHASIHSLIIANYCGKEHLRIDHQCTYIITLTVEISINHNKIHALGTLSKILVIAISETLTRRVCSYDHKVIGGNSLQSL